MRVLASPAFVNRRLNPYNWLLNTHLADLGVDVQGAAPWRLLRGQGDVWHLHWPEAVFAQRSAARAALGARALLHLAREGRRQGLALAWTVHNLQAHEGHHAALEDAFRSEFLPLVDGVVHLSHAGRAAAEARFPALVGRPAWVIPHGDYRAEYASPLDQAAARRTLDLPVDAPLVLSSGRIRPYKNVPALLDAFAALPDPAARCLVTGAATDAGLRRTIATAATADTRVRLDLRHLRPAALAAAHRAADLVVLPYREILNSGSALLALSLDRPVLVPRHGALGELAAQVGDDWVRCYDGDLTPAVLADALAWARETRRDARAPLELFAWPAIARAHRAVYDTLAGGRTRFPPSAHAGHRYAARWLAPPPRRLAWASPGLAGD